MSETPEPARPLRGRAPLWRWALFSFLLLATLFWGNRGGVLSAGWARSKGPTEAWADEAVAEYRAKDPQIALLIESSRREVRQLAILRAIDQAEGGGGGGLKRVAEGKRGAAKVGFGLVADLALDPRLPKTPEQRRGMVDAYGGYFALLRESGDEEMLEKASSKLSEAAASPELWEIVREDPAGLSVMEAVEDPALRKFYAAERDWLAEVIVQLVPRARGKEGSEEEPADPAEVRAVIRQAVEAAHRYRPYPRQACAELDLGAIAFTLFMGADREGPSKEGFGPVIVAAAGQGVPLDQLLDVLASNAPYLLDRIDQKGARGVAAEAVDLYRSRRAVWDKAKTYPLALQADVDLPEIALRLLEDKKYQDRGILDFLYTWYHDEKNPKVLRNAAISIEKYGDLAVFQLNRGKGDPRLLRLLGAQDHRVVAYGALTGDVGLDDAEKNPRWVDKYFDPGGNPVKARWWEGVPIVGAISKVVKNWMEGLPNTWEEYGWAALDVVDGVLLVASFGTSAQATLAKQGLKSASKQGFKAIARNATGEAASLTRKAVRSAGLTGTSFLARMGSRLGRSMAGRLAVTLVAWARVAIHSVGQAVAKAARGLRDGYRAISTGRGVYFSRALLALGLAVTVTGRTLPIWTEAAADVPGGIVEWAGKVIEKSVKGLARAIDDLLERWTGLQGGARAAATYYGVLALLVILTLAALPVRWRRAPVGASR